MSIKVICSRSKKGNLFYALSVNNVYVTFDVRTIAKVIKCDIRDIYILNDGECIDVQ